MNLRISSHRSLKTLPGLATRPTPSRVRAALFNIWQGEIDQCRWLDLCAGSGAMGAEALVRGAALAVGIEQSAKACQVVQENWRSVARPEQAIQVLCGDVLKKLPTLTEPFDRIYFDPPYAGSLYLPVLTAIAQYQLLALDGELAAEHDPRMSLPEVASLRICRQKRYGNTALTFYEVRSADESADG